MGREIRERKAAKWGRIKRREKRNKREWTKKQVGLGFWGIRFRDRDYFKINDNFFVSIITLKKIGLLQYEC